MTRAFLGLGSNLGDRRALLRDAQGAFLNLVVQLETDLDARALLGVCQEREAAADRVREERWGPRTLDVDVLWVDGETVDTDDLIVPHPRMRERAFVMVPLATLAPDLVDGWTDPAVGEVRNVGEL